MKAFVTDSASMLSVSTAHEWGVSVVPIGITLDGEPYQDGKSLSVDEYYERTSADSVAVTTSQPSPGEFVAVYEGLVARGATEIHSVHVGANLSGTCNSARLASADLSVPVYIYDSTTSSYGVSIALETVIGSINAGASQAEAERAMVERVSSLRTCFFMDRLEITARGIKTVPSMSEDKDLQSVWKVKADQLISIGEVSTMPQAAELMMIEAMKAPGAVHMAIGIGDLRNAPFAVAMGELAEAETRIRSIQHYRVGPSVAAYLGPNSGGIFWYPADAAAAG